MSEFDSQKATWNLIKANVPYIPEWVYKKQQYGKLGNPRIEEVDTVRKKNLNEFTPEAQERILIEDILDIMLGFEGVYIKKRSNRQ